MSKRIFTFIACIFFFHLFLASFCTCVLPQATAAEKIRIGYFLDLEGYQALSPEGRQSGYGYDYLQEIAQYNDWQYEYVTGSYTECLALLDAGKIDLMSAVLKSPETESAYNLTPIPIGNNYLGLFTLEKQTKYAYADFAHYNGIRIGMIDSPLSRQIFDSFCRENAIFASISFFKNHDALMQALRTGTVEATLMNSINVYAQSDHLRLLAKIAPIPLYFATPKGNTKVFTKLNSAMKKIQDDMPFFDNQLILSHYDSISSLVPALSKEELEYMKLHPVIKVVYDTNWLPIEYQDPVKGDYRGITAEIFKELSACTGLKFEFIPEKHFNVALEKLHTGQTDLLSGTQHDYNRLSEIQVKLTQPYLSVPLVMIYRHDSLHPEQRIALPRHFYISGTIAKRYSESDIRYYDTIEECLEAVRIGEASSTFTNAYVANYYLSLTKYMVFTSVTLTNLSENIAIAISGTTDPRLLSILNKGLQSISRDRMNQIIFQNIIIPQQIDWSDAVYANPIGAISTVLAIAAIIIISLSFVLIQKNKLRKEAESLLYQDALTGNRSYAKFLLDAPLRMKNKADEKFALLYMDMLQFKYINDTFGYEEGDKVLISISDLLDRFLTKNELFARVYADHFVILIKYATIEEFKRRIDSLEQSLTALPQETKMQYSFIFHGGIYLFNSIEKKIEIAIDRANYAKDTITDSSQTAFTYYDDQMRNQIIRNKYLERQMYPALKNHEYLPYLQPKINIVTGKIAGAEALVRWKDSSGNLVPPGDFIPFFEQNGFIVHLDFYIYEAVCQKLSEWLKAGVNIVPISCNFSRLHIKNPLFPTKLKEIADRYQVPHHLLELEITESVAIEDWHALSDCANLLKSFGFIISIDDFGAGYSSLGLIQSLPIDVLKLDRDFVINGLRGDLEKDLVAALVSIPNKHKISVICEGIETKSQENFIREIGCELAQGYFYARPMPVEEFEEKYICNESVSISKTE